MPDLVAHHVGRWRRPAPHDDLAVTVGAATGVPGRAPGWERDPVQPAHVIQVRHAPGTHVNRLKPGRELVLDQQRKLGKPVDRQHDGWRGGLAGSPFPVQHGFQRPAVPVPRRGAIAMAYLIPGPPCAPRCLACPERSASPACTWRGTGLATVTVRFEVICRGALRTAARTAARARPVPARREVAGLTAAGPSLAGLPGGPPAAAQTPAPLPGSPTGAGFRHPNGSCGGCPASRPAAATVLTG